MSSDSITSSRLCLDCPGDISHRSKTAKRCEKHGGKGNVRAQTQRAKINGNKARWDKQYKQARPELKVEKRQRERQDRQHLGRMPRRFKQRQFAKQHGLCAGCRGKHKIEQLTIDHVCPVSNGGTNAEANLQLLCMPCNSSKGDRDETNWRRSKFGVLL